MAAPTLHGCRIFVHDVAAATNSLLAAQYTPCEWEHAQHAVELWLSRALSHSPWRVRHASAADLLFLDSHHFSRWCTASRTLASRHFARGDAHAAPSERACEHAALPSDALPSPRGATPLRRDEKSKRRLWAAMVAGSAALGQRRGVPRVVALTSKECPRPFGGALPADLLFLPDSAARAFDQITPYVVSRPAWLVGGAAPPSAPAWAARRLLFFSGHVPKLHIAPLRFEIWRQLRGVPGVTALSSTIGCTVGAYALCADAARVAAEYATFCHAPCGVRAPCASSAAALAAQCRRAGRAANWSDPSLAADVRRAALPRPLAHEAYLALGLSHRFCLVAPGDFVSTHKISEAVALGGAGGCLPLFVLPHAGGAAEMLPYTRWLDYCRIGYVVGARAAASRMESVLRKLRLVSEAEARDKWEQLRLVREAFVFRRNSSVARPTAAEYILEEACVAARRFRTAGRAADARLPAPRAPRDARLQRCTL
ncbi:hypothetical protein AB1Y20_004190 [Prymnesium parvum]|uniref:Exostosin GT47 domain-containing protein n=1 Tax=Prymnesium parvum TaxID=97485 RepID=A0AB34J6W1_PRYPA